MRALSIRILTAHSQDFTDEQLLAAGFFLKQLCTSLFPKIINQPACHPLALGMAANRSDFDEGAPAKRQKTSNGNMDPRNNPYLQHMYTDESSDNASNGYNTPPRRLNGLAGSGPLAKFPRHKTTAAMARSVEDAQTNPFTGEPFSNRYMSILRTRRDLPVHAQRYAVWLQLRMIAQLTSH